LTVTTLEPVFESRNHAFSDHLFKMASIDMEYKDSVLLKESWFAAITVFKRDMSSTGKRNYSLK